MSNTISQKKELRYSDIYTRFRQAFLKLDEWGRLGQSLEDLPYSSIITGKTY